MAELISDILYFIASHFYYFVLLIWIFPIICHVISNVVLRKRLLDIASVGTRLSALGVSVFLSLGAFGVFMYGNCYFLTSPSKHPIRYPTSIVIMALSLAMFLFFFCLYISVRIKKGSILGACIEVVLAVLYSLPLFTVWFVVYFIAQEIYHYFFPLVY